MQRGHPSRDLNGCEVPRRCPSRVPQTALSIRARMGPGTMFQRGLIALVLAGFMLAAAPRATSGKMRAELVASGFTQPVAFVQDPSDPTVQVVVQQDGRVRALKNGVAAGGGLSGSAVRRAELRRAGPARAGVRARLRDQRPRLRELHQSGRAHGRRAVHAVGGRPAPRGPGDAASISSGPAASDSSRSRSRITTAATWRSVRTAFSTSAWATAAAATTRCISRRIRSRCSARCCASTCRCPTAIRRATTSRRQSVRRASPACSREIWSFGLRNPWRWSFDNPARGGTGALVIGDVGQGAWEEIDYEPAGRGGRNYGWRNREGAHNNVTTLPPFSQPLVDPIYEYGRASGQSITGGFVYRGSALGVDVSRTLLLRRLRHAAASGRCSCTSMRGTGEATASDLRRAHGGARRRAPISPSSFGATPPASCTS